MPTTDLRDCSLFVLFNVITIILLWNWKQFHIFIIIFFLIHVKPHCPPTWAKHRMLVQVVFFFLPPSIFYYPSSIPTVTLPSRPESIEMLINGLFYYRSSHYSSYMTRSVSHNGGREIDLAFFSDWPFLKQEWYTGPVQSVTCHKLPFGGESGFISGAVEENTEWDLNVRAELVGAPLNAARAYVSVSVFICIFFSLSLFVFCFAY